MLNQNGFTTESEQRDYETLSVLSETRTPVSTGCRYCRVVDISKSSSFNFSYQTDLVLVVPTVRLSFTSVSRDSTVSVINRRRLGDNTIEKQTALAALSRIRAAVLQFVF